ncbi:hypothetical protein PsorP6_008348 [Peronosclerospora sorghi]|uniref:Uncharacterized protein n=1 Tax=Peronosclerospora sorghi TaxID=230839 RepID=A0ACC0W9T2_9STRA|nr:hypothetical protein PsorP6_008348 [Peronosclerospora sorghi]
MVVASDGKSRAQIQRQLKQKAQAIRALTTTYASRAISRETLEQYLYSIADNQYHLYFERDPIDRMITLLTTHFDPENEDADWSLAIVSGSDGARLSHTHARQYHYVLQLLTLWRKIVEDLFRFWYLTDEDLLADGTIRAHGHGKRIASDSRRATRLARRARDYPCHAAHNVPNALMFIDKYTQVGHILRPIVKTVDRIESLCASSTAIADYPPYEAIWAASVRQNPIAECSQWETPRSRRQKHRPYHLLRWSLELRTFPPDCNRRRQAEEQATGRTEQEVPWVRRKTGTRHGGQAKDA